MPALTDHVNPLASRTTYSDHIADVKATKLSRTQPGMDRKANERIITATERLTKPDNGKQLLLLSRKQNTHDREPLSEMAQQRSR